MMTDFSKFIKTYHPDGDLRPTYINPTSIVSCEPEKFCRNEGQVITSYVITTGGYFPEKYKAVVVNNSAFGSYVPDDLYQQLHRSNALKWEPFITIEGQSAPVARNNRGGIDIRWMSVDKYQDKAGE